jgi:FkbM family methyltransferase
VLAEAFPDARIVTIEPSRDNFAVLRRNVEPYPRIVALNQALGPVEGTVTLRNRGTGEWGFTVVPEPSDCASPEVVHDVSVITVPAILEKFGVRGIDLLKLDIEGAECALLRGAPPWVAQTRVIFAELHDRIMPGCTSTFDAAMAGRRQLSSDGEKVLSVLS